MNQKAKIGIITILVIGAFAILYQSGSFTRLRTTGKATESPTGTNCRYVKEPYEAEETYTVTEPYEATEQYDYYPDYKVIDHQPPEQGMNVKYGVYHEASVTIENTDSEPTWFTVEYIFRNVEGELPKQSERHYLEPDESKTYTFLYDSEMGEDVSVEDYNVDVEPVTKTRTVTKQREVTKTRTVTKHRRVKKCD